jgi:hypothetical protein
MATDPKNDIDSIIDRVLRERLADFDVPVEVRNEIAREMLNILARPERKPYGACVMTPGASEAADRARTSGKSTPGDGEKPQIV